MHDMSTHIYRTSVVMFEAGDDFTRIASALRWSHSRLMAVMFLGFCRDNGLTVEPAKDSNHRAGPSFSGSTITFKIPRGWRDRAEDLRPYLEARGHASGSFSEMIRGVFSVMSAGNHMRLRRIYRELRAEGMIYG